MSSAQGADTRSRRRRFGPLLLAVGVLTIASALAVLVAIDPSETGGAGAVREGAVFALIVGLILAMTGALERVTVPSPAPAPPHRHRGAWAAGCGAGYSLLAWLQRDHGPWLLLLAGAVFLGWGAVLLWRDRRTREADDASRRG